MTIQPRPAAGRQPVSFDQLIPRGGYLALCCECGNQRTCKRPRNYVYDGGTTWTRMVGDLKCSACGRVTSHAIVCGNDSSERVQAFALGMPDPDPYADNARLQDQYRQGLPRNPLLEHAFWEAARKKAVEHNTRLRTFCGELIDPPQPSDSLPLDLKRDWKPEVDIHDDASPEEIEDPATGLYWRQGPCVNCQRVVNVRLLQERRKLLATMMTQALAELLDSTQTHHYDQYLETLTATLKAVHDAS